MNLSSKDIVITLLGCSVIAASSIGLYVDYQTRIRTSQTDVIGTISFKKKTAERKYTDQMIWEDVSQESPVYNNDSIRTAEGSAAIVHLKNGTDIDLDENTLVMFSFSSKGADINLDGGSIFAKTAETGGGAVPAVSIRSGGTSVSVTSGALNLTKKADKAVDLSVSSGTAVLTGGAGSVAVGANQTATIAGGKADVKKNTVELTAPDPNTYLIAPSGGSAPVAFAWKGVSAGSLEVAADRGFKKSLIKKDVSGSSSESFAKGDYYWRVKGNDGSTSEIRKFSVLEDAAAVPLAPKNGTSISYVAGNPLVQLAWSPSSYASAYEVEISRDQQFKDTVLRINSAAQTIATDQLKEGVYYWHVRPVYNIAQKTAFSNKLSFSIVHLKKALPPEIQSPASKTVKSESAAAAGKMTFSWQGSSDFKEYIIELSRDETFASHVLKETVSSYYYRYMKDLSSGVYYWRVTGRSAEGVNSDPSTSGTFTVIKNRPPSSLAAVSESAASMRISWKDPDGIGKYRLEIAGDASFAQKVLSAEYAVSSASVKDLAQGDYFYRVSSIDVAGSVAAVSPPEKMTVAGVLDQPSAIAPMNNSSVDIMKTRAIDFSWKPVPLATGYVLEIYQYSFASNRLMFSTETADTRFSLKQLSALANGNFYWQVSALRKKGQSVTARSMPAKGYFNIPAGPEIKAPKLGNLKVYVE